MFRLPWLPRSALNISDRFTWTDPNRHWLLRDQLDASSRDQETCENWGRDLLPLEPFFLSPFSRSRRSMIFVLDWTELAGRTRLPDSGWEYGFDLRFFPAGDLHLLEGPVLTGRQQVEKLSAFHHRPIRFQNGIGIHFIHGAPGKGPAPIPIVITHGWPGSFFGNDGESSLC